MAEIQQNATGPPKNGKRRAKKMSTRIDMTPMVDLAFLLLTFFMLTTTFAKPYTVDLLMPVKNSSETPVPMSKALTIILGKGHQVHYFFGLNTPKDPAVPRAVLRTTPPSPPTAFGRCCGGGSNKARWWCSSSPAPTRNTRTWCAFWMR